MAALRLVLGLGLVALVVWLRGGLGALWHELSLAGLPGILAVSTFHAIPMATCGLAWSSLLGKARPAARAGFVLARWVRDGVNQLLPFVPLGGEVAGARIVAARGGVSGPTAAAFTVVDITAELMSQAVFTLIGAGLWLIDRPAGLILGPAGIGIALCLPMVAALLLTQKLGMVRLLERLADRVMPEAWRNQREAAPIHDTMVAIYAERRRFTIASSIHLAAWVVAGGEAWLALRLLGHPLRFTEVIAMESVIYAVRNAAFLVPGALGVQEGAYVLVGAALGLPADIALALSLIKRGRELLMGVPALVTWQMLGRGPARTAG